MANPNHKTTCDAIRGLAEEIAQSNPDCASKAMRILALLDELSAEPDRASIEDAIDVETDGDLSDTRVRNTSSAVVRTMRDEP